MDRRQYNHIYGRPNFLRYFFTPIWLQNTLSFIETISFSLLPTTATFLPLRWPPFPIEFHSEASIDCYTPLLPQANGSEFNLATMEDHRRLDQSYYQGHSTYDMDEVDDATMNSDRDFLVHDKRKNYGALSISQISENARMDYMWKNIDVFGEATPTEISCRRRFMDRIKSCCSGGKKSQVPRKHLLKNGENFSVSFFH